MPRDFSSFSVSKSKCIVFFIVGQGDLPHVWTQRVVQPVLSTDRKELVMNGGDNLTLRCSGDYPVQWTYPEYQVHVSMKASIWLEAFKMIRK